MLSFTFWHRKEVVVDCGNILVNVGCVPLIVSYVPFILTTVCIQVKARTSNHETYRTGSHVMQYGDINIDIEEMEQYLGFDPANENVTKHVLRRVNLASTLMAGKEFAVNQHDVDLLSSVAQGIVLSHLSFHLTFFGANLLSSLPSQKKQTQVKMV